MTKINTDQTPSKENPKRESLILRVIRKKKTVEYSSMPYYSWDLKPQNGMAQGDYIIEILEAIPNPNTPLNALMNKFLRRLTLGRYYFEGIGKDSGDKEFSHYYDNIQEGDNLELEYRVGLEKIPYALEQQLSYHGCLKDNDISYLKAVHRDSSSQVLKDSRQLGEID